ncbi:MAG: hypothetical protein LBQ98_07440 [Nitrososphaerota archaeon]|nr:hypothetical protein [Nitrososphaerota archaeon]
MSGDLKGFSPQIPRDGWVLDNVRFHRRSSVCWYAVGLVFLPAILVDFNRIEKQGTK